MGCPCFVFHAIFLCDIFIKVILKEYTKGKGYYGFTI